MKNRARLQTPIVMRMVCSLFFSLLLLTLTGCGFHLRGRVPLPPQFQHIYIQSETPYDPFIIELKDSLEDMNVVVVDNPIRAKLTLHVIKQTTTNSLGNISASTNTRQYTIYYSVEFALLDEKQQPIIPANTLSTNRSLIVNSNAILGSSSEEQTLIKEMRKTIIQLMVAKLGARNTVKALNALPIATPIVR